MNLSHPSGKLPFNHNSLPLLVALANQAAVAIAHSELHRSLLEKERIEQQLETAQSIQESFIAPEIHIKKESYIFSGLNSAARAVGGDLYDVVEIDGGRAAIFLGDVSGKGFPAALYMARLFSDIHHFIGIDPRPEAVFASLNASLCSRRHRGMFTTMVYGLITPNEPEVKVCMAGHPSPIVRKSDGPVIALPPAASPPLGLIENVSYSSFSVNLRPGDLMLFYSDGVNEATNPAGEDFGVSRIEKSLGQNEDNIDPASFLFGRLTDFTNGHPAHDDITMLLTARV